MRVIKGGEPPVIKNHKNYMAWFFNVLMCTSYHIGKGERCSTGYNNSTKIIPRCLSKKYSCPKTK